MTLIRRFLTLVAFAFWQGGFTFYTAVAVPIGTDVLGSPAAQGMITRRVAFWINVTGAIALVVLTADTVMTRQLRVPRVVCLLLMAFGLIALFILHQRLDSMMDANAGTVLDRRTFRHWHRVYLWISTGEWMVGVVWLALTPLAWRRADRA